MWVKLSGKTVIDNLITTGRQLYLPVAVDHNNKETALKSMHTKQLYAVLLTGE